MFVIIWFITSGCVATAFTTFPANEANPLIDLMPRLAVFCFTAFQTGCGRIEFSKSCHAQVIS